MLQQFNDKNDFENTLTINGTKRSYYLRIPPGSSTDPAQLVFLLHGASGYGQRIARVSRFNEIADKHGIIVVYPDALDRHWNDTPNGTGTIDDVLFIDTLVEECEKMFTIDSRRIYVAGVSNGGMMAFRLICELSDKFAAMASVAGYMVEGFATKSDLKHPVPVILFHGTDDTYVPFMGGESKRGLSGKIMSTPAVASYWSQINGCNPTPESTMLAKKNPADATQIQQDIYKNSELNTEVILYTIHGGGHTWPSGNGGSERVLGRTSLEINASLVIWEFFNQHPKIT